MLVVKASFLVIYMEPSHKDIPNTIKCLNFKIFMLSGETNKQNKMKMDSQTFNKNSNLLWVSF